MLCLITRIALVRITREFDRNASAGAPATSAAENAAKAEALDYKASLSNTALHRSWILAERAFGQLASVCSRSVILASPCVP